MKYIVLVGNAQCTNKAKDAIEFFFEIDSVIQSENDLIRFIQDKNKYSKKYDIVVCDVQYLSIGKLLFDEGIDSYYVFIDGLLYKCNTDELMQPIELCTHRPYKKNNIFEKNILFIKKNIVTNEKYIVKASKEKSYSTILLCTGKIFEEDNEIYDYCVSFTSLNGILEYLRLSEIDIIHCFEGSNTISNIAMLTNIPIIYEVDSEIIKSTNLILEYMLYKYSSGIVFNNIQTKKIYNNLFGISKKQICLLYDEKNTPNDERSGQTKLGDFYENIRKIC